MSCKIDEALVIVDKAINVTKDKGKKEALIGIRERMVVMKSTSEASMQQTKTTAGFKGYAIGFDSKGKGTPEGDGKDKAMRKIADGFIGEIGSKKGSKSSTATSLKHWFPILSDKELDKEVTNGIRSWSSVNRDMVPIPKDAVIMLARNSEFANKPLDAVTKTRITEEHRHGSSFVVGDMPNVDTQFIDYLDKIGATYTVYSTAKNENEVFNRQGYDGKEWRERLGFTTVSTKEQYGKYMYRSAEQVNSSDTTKLEQVETKENSGKITAEYISKELPQLSVEQVEELVQLLKELPVEAAEASIDKLRHCI